MKAKKADSTHQDPKEYLRKIGKKMTQKRKQLGYKNADVFAYDKGINRSQYGKYEAGSQDMRVGSLIKIVNLLGSTMEDFFSEGMDS